jgi:hypothetical protein
MEKRKGEVEVARERAEDLEDGRGGGCRIRQDLPLPFPVGKKRTSLWLCKL